MSYSPRQMMAWLELGNKRRGREMARQVAVVRLAQHGDKRQVTDQIKEWTKG